MQIPTTTVKQARRIECQYVLQYCRGDMGESWIQGWLRREACSLMAAAVEFNYAVFYIFSGPLFANLEGYVFMDLLVWGVSPLLFEMARQPLTDYISPSATVSRIKGSLSKGMMVRRRLVWLWLFWLELLIAFLFMNYSSGFRWNYLSRLFNLDFGYLLFDFGSRCMELIVEIQTQEHMSQLDEDSLEPVLYSAGYSRNRNIAAITAYFLIFYFSVSYDTQNLDTGIQVFGSISIVCLIFALTVPLLYMFRQQQYSNYDTIQQEPKLQTEELEARIEEEATNQPQQWRSTVVLGLAGFSHFVNTSYFSLWIMEGLRQQNKDDYQLLNKTLLVSALFFLVASFLQFILTHIFLACDSPPITQAIRPFLFGYGVLMMTCFVLSGHMEWHYMVVPIFPYAFLNAFVNHYAFRQGLKANSMTPQRVFLWAESTAYLLIPILITIIGQDNASLWFFGYLSAGTLLVAGVLL